MHNQRAPTYHPANLHLGPCSSVGMRRGTDTDIQTAVTNIHFASATTHAKCNNVTTAAATHSDNVTTSFNFSWQLLGTVNQPWNHSDPAYSVNVTITINIIHCHYCHFANNQTAAKFLWPDASLAKNFQDQLNSRRFLGSCRYHVTISQVWQCIITN